jgi:RNA polymerase sigma-70 factor (ECF subfamily)
LYFPETDPILLARLNDASNESAWCEFVELYRPALLGFGRRKGLQPSDAEDLAQGVLLAVATSIAQWEPDARRARFSTWLFTVANRHVIDAMRRRSKAARTGSTSLQERLAEQAERREDSRILRDELRRELFRHAAAAISDEFSDDAWASFRLMAIEGLPATDAAARLGKTVGAVYAAKGRVMRRLIDRVRELEEQTGTSLAAPQEGQAD